MSQQSFPVHTGQSEHTTHLVRLLGVDGSVSKVEGKGITIAYVSEGVYTATWSDNPGRFLGYSYGFQATTPGDVKSYTVVCEPYNTTAYSIKFTVYSSGTAADLIALQWLSLKFDFARTGL